MNNYYLTDEDIHGFEEDETETEKIKSKLDEANQRIEELEDLIKYAIKILNGDINGNNNEF